MSLFADIQGGECVFQPTGGGSATIAPASFSQVEKRRQDLCFQLVKIFAKPLRGLAWSLSGRL